VDVKQLRKLSKMTINSRQAKEQTIFVIHPQRWRWWTCRTCSNVAALTNDTTQLPLKSLLINFLV